MLICNKKKENKIVLIMDIENNILQNQELFLN